MSRHELNWVYAEGFAHESAPIQHARNLSTEYGVTCVSPAVGAQMAALSAVMRASTILEIGTGLGVSGLWLLHGSPEASITSIDIEFEYHEHAKEVFASAGIVHTKARLITGSSSEVLPRMNENSYDIVLIDSDPRQLMENVEHALRLVRIGGVILVPHALWEGQVPDPTKRDATTTTFRSLLALMSDSEAVLTALSPAGDGLLQIVRRD